MSTYQSYLYQIVACLLFLGCTCCSAPKETVYLTLATNRSIGDKIFLSIEAAPEDYDRIWIDLNANGHKEEEEGVSIFSAISEGEKNYGEYTLRGSVVTIYGPITSLVCNSAGIYMLDLSQSTSLRYLECKYNQIKDLDTSLSPHLTALHCDHNLLTEINLTQNSALEHLSLSANTISHLDLSECKNLISLQCSITNLSALDLSTTPLLKHLVLGNNLLTDLNLNQNPRLKFLVCHNTRITHLDLTENKDLEVLSCSYTDLSSLQVSPLGMLKSLLIADNKLEKNEIETLLGQLPSSPGIICIEGNPGAAHASRQAILTKGWAELSREDLAHLELTPSE